MNWGSLLAIVLPSVTTYFVVAGLLRQLTKREDQKSKQLIDHIDSIRARATRHPDGSFEVTDPADIAALDQLRQHMRQGTLSKYRPPKKEPHQND